MRRTREDEKKTGNGRVERGKKRKKKKQKRRRKQTKRKAETKHQTPKTAGRAPACLDSNVTIGITAKRGRKKKII